MLLTKEINIRDPYVFPYDGKYFLYGTRGATCWSNGDGFDGYYSTDLEHWEGPFEIFHRPEGFWADKNYWAPEIHFYNGAFYMFATFSNQAEDPRGTMILKADNPLGPYSLHSNGKVTPEDWNCLDGTLYVNQDNKPYMVFAHEWVDLIDGEICAMELLEDLSGPAGKPVTLFKASEAVHWVKPISHRFYPGQNVYVTDGPFMYRTKEGKLLMLWSSFGEKGYVEAISYSESGDILGPWKQTEETLFPENGGHGMLFRTYEGELMLTLHTPNTHLEEHPVFIPLKESDILKLL